ncbi:MAG: GNAT family N-acetyltransferase [Burkholderiales bacterium]
MTDTTLTLSLERLPSSATLEPLWRALEGRSDGGFFISWTWVSCWLAGLPPRIQPQLLVARDGDRVMGLAVVVSRLGLRRGCIPVRTACLHETGDPVCDGITIEHNDFLVSRDAPDTLRQQMLAHWLQADRRSEEFRLAYLGRSVARVLPAEPLTTNVTEYGAYHVDLAAIRTAGTDYLGSLKQRSRYLVRKSLKRLGETAPLSLLVAQTVEEARRQFGELKRLHTEYWAARGDKGAFGSLFAEQFHDRLISVGVPRGEVVVLSVCRGEQVLGYFYYFCFGGRVHYYQSGIDYGVVESTDSPGLAAHALAIEHFLGQGHDLYDFMAGDYQYKRTLASGTQTLYWTTLQRASVKLRVESALLQRARQARDWWARRRSTPPPASAGAAAENSP